MSRATATRVLVVDDHQLNARFVQIVLTRAGLSAWTVHSAASALEFLDGNAVDVIITDISMPVMSGTELFRNVIARFGSARPRVIAYTALALEHECSAILAEGFDALLVKPATPDEILAALCANEAQTAPDE